MTNTEAVEIIRRYIDLDSDVHSEFFEAIKVMAQTIDEIERIINCDNPVGGELPFQIQEDVIKYKMICEVMKNDRFL